MIHVRHVAVIRVSGMLGMSAMPDSGRSWGPETNVSKRVTDRDGTRPARDQREAGRVWTSVWNRKTKVLTTSAIWRALLTFKRSVKL